MKKLFALPAVASIVIAGLFGCSSESTTSVEMGNYEAPVKSGEVALVSASDAKAHLAMFRHSVVESRQFESTENDSASVEIDSTLQNENFAVDADVAVEDDSIYTIASAGVDGSGFAWMVQVENGAVVYGPGREDTAPLLSKTEIPREAALRLIREILALPGCEPLVSGVGTSFLFPGYGEALRRDLEHRLHNRVTVVRQPEEIGEAIVKVAAFCPESLEEPARLLTPRWQTQVHVAVAGKEWLDFTTADKGDGLRRLSTALGVPLAEIAAFGDNENDIAMLETAGEAWLMSAAAPALLRRFPRHCASVPPVLERYLAAQTPAQMENQSN